MSGCVFITGASSGFGRSCARIFSENGWKVVAAARRMDRLDALKSELDRHAPCYPLCLDVRDKQAVKSAVEGLPEPFSNVDVLVNNAGLALGLASAHEANIDDWDIMVDTNIKGLLYCARYLLTGMVARGKGHIINVGSVAGDYPYPGGNVYGATKAFVKQFSRNLRADLVDKNIRVTNIEPGLCETEFSIVRFKGDTDKAKEVYAGTDPLSADDIANIIYWVATLPSHINVNRLEVMPVCQAFGPFAIHRE